MRMSDRVTYSFNRPLRGMIRDADRVATWEMTEATFSPLAPFQEPPTFDLIMNMHHALRDAEGDLIPIEVLSLFDLEQGLRDAFNREFGAAWRAVEAVA
jgi:hypothetical protein